MTEEEMKTDDLNIHGLSDHKALRKMGTERLKELLDQTYEMRKDRFKLNETSSTSANDYIDEWITVVEWNWGFREAFVENRLDANCFVLTFHCSHGYRVVVLDPTYGRLAGP